MIRTLSAMAMLAASGIAAVPAEAQAPSPAEAAPRITAVQPGAERLYNDLEYVLGLTSASEQQQLKNIKEYLDIFLIGVDRDRPLRLDALTAGPEIRYRFAVPVVDLETFRDENLGDLGIDSRKLFVTLYRLRDEANSEVIGFMRTRHNYAFFSSQRTIVPNTLPDPLPPVKDLAASYDAAVALRNGEASPEAVAVRRETYPNVRAQLLEMLEQGEEESDEDFQFRRLLAEVALDELGRVYAEALQAKAGLIIDAANEAAPASLDVRVDPLAESGLQGAFALLGAEPSFFANVPRSENTILSGRVNHPLDEMRRENALRISRAMRERTKADIDGETESTDQEKADRKKAADIFFDMIDAGLAEGLLDGFIEAHPAAGKHTVVGGFRTLDGTQMVEVVKLIPEESRGQSAELNVDQAGDVQIHKFVAGGENAPLFDDFLGSDVLYIGTSKQAVWYAAGRNALDELKAAVAQVGEEPAGEANPFVDVFIKLGPWMKLRQARHAGAQESEQRLKLRQMAVDAFAPGDDALTFRLNRVDDHVEGTMTGQPGILRLFGKFLADFSEENL